MIGCFGVAPDRGEAISTATSGAHGGNMDYAGFVAGVTVWFPVSVPGALFFLGDVHAVQGDGEITGNGVEVSADVTFSVRVLSGRTIAWPRAISAEHLMTVGCGRPLDQCVQYATGEMLRWLGEARAACDRRAHPVGSGGRVRPGQHLRPRLRDGVQDPHRHPALDRPVPGRAVGPRVPQPR